MQEAATHDILKNAFEVHCAESDAQIERLEKVFDMLGMKPSRVTCEGTKGLIEEASEAVEAGGEDDVRDAALIAAANRVEHYEIAGYGVLIAFARRLDMNDAAALFEQSLQEENEADHKLTEIAETGVNAAAVTSGS